MPIGDLQDQVIRELKFDPSIDASRIGVTATGGVVTLTGTVPAYFQNFERGQRQSASKPQYSCSQHGRVSGDEKRRSATGTRVTTQAGRKIGRRQVCPVERGA